MIKKDVDNKLPIYKLTSKEEVLDYYENWTDKSQYNQDMIDWQYTAPQHSVNLFKQHASNKGMRILNAGCGSGLVGIELKKEGYINLEGIDFSQSMLNIIPEEIYNSTKLIDLNEPLYFEDNYFDAIMCVGTFTYGHVKAHTLNEFIRITKNNGLICFTVNEGIYNEYEFDKKIEELSKNNFWKVISLKKSPYIENKNIESWLCLSEVCKN